MGKMAGDIVWLLVFIIVGTLFIPGFLVLSVGCVVGVIAVLGSLYGAIWALGKFGAMTGEMKEIEERKKRES